MVVVSSGGDGFISRNIFWDYVVHSKKGFYVEAGANDYDTGICLQLLCLTNVFWMGGIVR